MKSFSNETLNFYLQKIHSLQHFGSCQNCMSSANVYMVLQCSKLFYSEGSSGFQRQDSQSSCSFGKIQNVGDLELSEEKNLVFH